MFLQLLESIVNINNKLSLDAKFRLGVHYGEFESGLYSPITGRFSNVHGETLDIARQICSDCPDNSLLASQTAFQMAGEDTRVVGEEYGVSTGAIENHADVHTVLCSNALASYRQLLDLQAIRLQPLLSGRREVDEKETERD